MDRRNLVRICTILLFLSMSVYFVRHPIFEDSDLSQQEREVASFYFREIVDKSEDGYIVETGISKRQIEVITDAHFEIGDVISFYGLVKDNRLVVQKHRLHKHPDTPLHLSLIGLVGFLWLMKREEV